MNLIHTAASAPMAKAATTAPATKTAATPTTAPLEHDAASPVEGAPPRTVTVLGLLVGVALVFSWLLSYALVNAMLAAELIRPWAEGQDPRPRWMLEWFAALTVVFVGIGGAFRWLSRRQLRKIDAMVEEEEQARRPGRT